MRVLAEQLVGADDDVNGAVLDALECGGDFLCRTEAAHFGNLHRPFGKAVGQGLEMLLGQKCGGRQKGHLFAAGDCNKSRAQGHLGLAKAHIAANQPIHGARADHVLDDGVDGGLLVGGFLKAEVVGKGLVIAGREAEGKALAGGPTGVDVQEFGGRIAHLFGSAPLGLFPLARTQPVQRRLIGGDAGIAADQLQLADRHIQRGRVGIFQVQEFLQLRLTLGILVAHIHVDQAPVAAYAVRGVHHRVAQGQLGQVLDQGLDIADLLLLFAPARHGAGCKQLGLGDQIDTGLQPAKADRQAGRGNAPFFAAGYEFLQRVKGGRVDLRGAQKVQEAFATAIALGQHQQPLLGVACVVFELGQRVFGAAQRGHGGQGADVGIGRGCFFCGVGFQCQLRVAIGQGIKLLGAQKQAFGRQGRALGVALHQTVSVLGVLPEAMQGGLQVAV